MRYPWRLSVVMVALCGAGVVYLQHVKGELTREVRALAKAVEARDPSRVRAPNAVPAILTAATLEEAARRGALTALASGDRPSSPCVRANGEQDEVPSGSPSRASSPEALHAFDEGGAIVAAALQRKVWTEEDRLALEARLPLLDAHLRDEVIGRVVQAANAGILNLSATHGQVF